MSRPSTYYCLLISLLIYQCEGCLDALSDLIMSPFSSDEDKDDDEEGDSDCLNDLLELFGFGDDDEDEKPPMAANATVANDTSTEGANATAPAAPAGTAAPAPPAAK